MLELALLDPCLTPALYAFCVAGLAITLIWIYKAIQMNDSDSS